MASESTRRERRPGALWRKAVWLCLIIGAMAFGVFVWHSCQRTDITARQTDLLLLRTRLVGFADKWGHYPPALADVFGDREGERLRDDLELDSLVYVAAELPCCPGGQRELLYERVARRYGFTKGWFQVYEGWVQFVPGERCD